MRSRHSMVRVRPLIAATLLVLAAGQAPQAAPGEIEEVIVQGLRRMTRQSFDFAFEIAAGDPYDEAKVRRQFRELWKRKLFEDITIEAEPGPDGGTVLIVKVRERPMLSSVTYDDNKVVTQTQIEDRYKENDIRMRLGSPIDLGEVYFAEAAVRDLLSEQGYLDATVKARVKNVTETARSIHFEILPGGKTRIRSIEFAGNEIYSDRKLKGGLKLTQERHWYWPWSSKNLYHPVKWDQDVSALRDLYQNQGYLDVEFRAPVVEVRREGGETAEQPEIDLDAPLPTVEIPEGELSPKKLAKLRKKERKLQERERKRRRALQMKRGKRWVHLTVPVVEGRQYVLGDLTFEGNQVFDSAGLRSQIPLNEGAVLSEARLDFGTDRISRLYEDIGHLYSNVVRRIERRADEDIADVVVVIDEDESYTIGRIEFEGNSATHDRVLRREVALVEGQRFNRSLLDLSQRKVNQLGYFQVTGEPLIEPIEDTKTVRVRFGGEEQGRNEIQVGGGYSGLDGAFFNGVYSTRNFLGRGQVLSTALQIGGRSNRYQLSFQEPWFLNRPYLFGVSLFRRDTDFGDTLRSTSSGGSLVLGRRLGPFARINLGYSYEDVSSTTVALGLNDDLVSFRATNEISSLTPVFSYSTINNPYRPSRGLSLDLSFQVAGGPLGGDTSYLKPQANMTWYRKAVGRSFVGLHLQGGLVREFDEGSNLSTSNIEGVPRFQRFWLGGDQIGPRVFETRTITPRRYVELDGNRIVGVLGDPRFQSPEDLVTSGGIPVPIEVGGDRMYLFQAEWVLPMNEQAEIAAFFDVGDALFDDTDFGFDTARASAGVELRFHLPIFPVPLRLIYGTPVRKLAGDRTSSFTFSIGRSF